VSLSDGNLVLVEAHPSYVEISKKWTAHDYEPWIAAWDYWDTNIVFSGGDDFKLKAWDVRSPMCDPTFVNRRFVFFLESYALSIFHILDSMQVSQRFNLTPTLNTFSLLAGKNI
jgi:WD40 repeat protein